MQENTDQKNSVFAHFSCSNVIYNAIGKYICSVYLKFPQILRQLFFIINIVHPDMNLI